MKTFPVGLFQCNCSLIVCPKTRQALVIDPGGDWPLIRRELEKEQATVAWILHTHAHIDHLGATQHVREHWKASQCALHAGDRPLVENIPIQAQFLNLPSFEVKEMDHWLSDGESVRVGETVRVEVAHTPGHTPGSVCFLVEESGRGKEIFSGDTLFQGSIGRTDLWGGDFEQLMSSIHDKLMQWPDDVRVIPGHGPATTLQEERAHNPFLQGERP